MRPLTNNITHSLMGESFIHTSYTVLVSAMTMGGGFIITKMQVQTCLNGFSQMQA